MPCCYKKGQRKIARLVQERKEALDPYLHDVVHCAAAWLDNKITALLCIFVSNTVDAESIIKSKVCTFSFYTIF